MTAYTHVGMVANFAGGAVSQSVFSFDSPLSRIMFEVTGTEGTPMASGSLGYRVLDVTSTTDLIPLLPEGWDPYESTLQFS